MSKEVIKKDNIISNIVTANPDIHGGRAVFKGTRIPVSLIADCLSNGWSVEQMASMYPSIKRTYISNLFKAISVEQELSTREPMFTKGELERLLFLIREHRVNIWDKKEYNEYFDLFQKIQSKLSEKGK